MTTWSIADRETELFTGRTFSGPNGSEKMNTPKGCIAIEGTFDHLKQRPRISTDVDQDTGESVDVVTIESYEPPVQAAADIARRERRSALVELRQLDKQAVRYIAEKVTGTIDAEGERRLDAIMARKAEIREKLAAT